MRAAWPVLALMVAASLAGCVDPGDLGNNTSTDAIESPPQVRPRTTVAGILVSTDRSGDRVTFAVDATILDCEAVDRRVERTANVSAYEEQGDSPVVDELRDGDAVVVELWMPPGSQEWELGGLDRNVSRERTRCQDHHDRDLIVRPHHDPMAFPEDETRTVAVEIRNRQDDTLPVRFGEAFLVNLSMLRDTDDCGERPDPDSGPRRPEREDCEDAEDPTPQDARIEACTVDAPDPRDVPGNGTVDVHFDVTCDRSYSREEVRDLGLWANASFTDELGGEHPLPAYGPRVLVEFEDLQEARSGPRPS